MTSRDRHIIAFCLVAFVMAGLTGAFFRWGMSGEAVYGLTLGNIRHAHSHLMYFSWATPALMVLLVPGDRWIQAFAFQGLVLGFVSYPFFLLYGYGSVSVGTASLPISAILSGIIMLTWYGFVARWYRIRKDDPLETLAVAFLVFSSVGAWGISATIPLGLHAPSWAESFKYLFLGHFTEGWLTLATVALVYRKWQPTDHTPIPRAIIWLLCLGVGTVFMLGMPQDQVTVYMQWMARAGAVMSGIALLWIAAKVWRQASPWWKLPVAALGAKALSLLFLAPWPTIWWAENHQDRIMFVHLVLLGIVSSTIILCSVLDGRATRAYLISVVVLLGFLVPVSSVWVLPSVALTWIDWITPVSVLPAIAAIPLAVHLFRRSNPE